MRKIAVMIGSDSDLPPCALGLRYLSEMEKKGAVKVEGTGVITNSIHRNTLAVLRNVETFSRNRFSRCEKIKQFPAEFFISSSDGLDALIIGAGMAAHLPGDCDSYLRYGLKDSRIVVIGVAFEDKDDPENTKAAILSITKVPGTQVVFDNFVGEGGFLRACKYAVEGKLPDIKLRKPKPVIRRTLRAAIEAAERKIEKIKQEDKRKEGIK